MTRQYEPFQIRVGEQNGDGYPVLAEFLGASWRGTLEADLPLLKETEIQQALGWLERGFIDRDYAKDFGRRLFETLFTGAVREGFRAAYERSADAGGLRIVLTLPDSLAGLPWELMYDEEGEHGFMARSVTVPLVRHFAGLPLPHRTPQASPLRVLVVTASPAGHPPVSSETEESALSQSLTERKLKVGERIRLAWQHFARTRSIGGLVRHLRQQSMVSVQILSHATRSSLQACLVDAANAGAGYHVVHFVGHGEADGNGGRILLENKAGEADPVLAEELAEIVDEPTVNLAVFNACQTASAVSVFDSVAEATLRRGVPAVIGMQVPVFDQAAVQFAREFYGSWASGEPCESALAYARRTMRDQSPGAAADWGIPILYMGPTKGLRLQMPAPRLLTPRRILSAIGFVLLTLIPTLYFYFDLVPRGPDPLEKTFNVAVAEFGEQRGEGKPVRSSEAGKWISDTIYEELDRAIGQDQELRKMVQVGHERIGPVEGATKEERDRAAGRLADQLNATVVIYGTLDRSQPPYSFVPEFYVSPDFGIGEELSGANAFGAPIRVYLPLSNDANRWDAFNVLYPRSQAFSHFTMGLAQLYDDRPDQALVSLERAAKAGWELGLDEEEEQLKGKEVVWLFMGAAWARRNRPGDLKRAEAAFEKALELTSGQYVRAHIGLGNLLLKQGTERPRPDGTTQRFLDPSLIDSAIAEYEKALDAPEEWKSQSAYVDLKALYSLGLAHMWRARSLDQECPDQDAVATLQQAISAYAQDAEVALVKELGAKSRYQLGLLLEVCADQRKRKDMRAEAAGLYEQAAQQYRESIAIATPKVERLPGFLGLPIGPRPAAEREQKWQQTRWTAQHKLAYTYCLRAELGNPELYREAADIYREITGRYETGNSTVSDALAAEAYYNLGQAWEHIGDRTEASLAYRRVVDIESGDAELGAKARSKLAELDQ